MSPPSWCPGLSSLILFLRDGIGEWFFHPVLGNRGDGAPHPHTFDLCGRTDGQGDDVPRRNTESRLGEIPRKEVRESQAGTRGEKGSHWPVPSPLRTPGWPLHSTPPFCSMAFPPCRLIWPSPRAFPQWCGELRGSDTDFFLSLPSTLRFPPNLSLAALLQPPRLKNLPHGRKVGTMPRVVWGAGGESGDEPPTLFPLLCSLIVVILINAR